jgi:hypothetical protein
MSVSPPETVVSCSYCGEAFPPGALPSQEALLVRHEWNCDRHPLAKIKAELLALCRLVDNANDGGRLARITGTFGHRLVDEARELTAKYTIGLNDLYPKGDD